MRRSLILTTGLTLIVSLLFIAVLYNMSPVLAQQDPALPSLTLAAQANAPAGGTFRPGGKP